MDIIIKENTGNEDLELKLPPDRVVTIDDNGVTYLADTQFVIIKEMIKKVIND